MLLTFGALLSSVLATSLLTLSSRWSGEGIDVIRRTMSRVLTVVVIAGVVVVSAPIAAHGKSGVNQPTPESVIVGGGGAARAVNVEDAALLASSSRTSLNAVTESLVGQDEFLEAVSVAYGSYADRFFSSTWEPASLRLNGYKGWVSFAGGLDKTIVGLFSKLPVPVQLRFGASASAADLEVVREKAMAAIFEQTSGLIGLTGDFTLNGDLVIEYEYADAARSIESVAALQAKVADVARTAPVEIVVKQATGIAPTEEVVRGGVSFGGCTLGFAATRGSTSGAITAGHCANTSGTAPFGSAYPLNYVLEHIGTYGDGQFHSTVDSLSNAIRISSSGTLRTITGKAYPSNGASVCNYGVTRTTAACTSIRNWNHAFYNESGVYLSRMAQTNGTFTNPGDSGGPWYYSSTAYGVHFGKSGGYSTMSRVPDLEAILSLYIRTS